MAKSYDQPSICFLGKSMEDCVMEVLTLATNPLIVAEILKKILDGGHKTDAKRPGSQVSKALGQLKAAGRAVKADEGGWLAV